LPGHQHPPDRQLARYQEQPTAGPVGLHVLGCRLCRNAVTEYGWLGVELAAVLHSIAERSGEPHEGWRAVQRGTKRRRRQRLAGWYGAATFGIALALSLAFATSLAVGPDLASRGTMPSLRIVRFEATVPSRVGFAGRPTPAVTPVPLPPKTARLGNRSAPSPAPVPTAPTPRAG
jgi:hypothetical protein